MGIQINGQNDNISATDGGLTISDLEINQSGISTFNGSVIIGTGATVGFGTTATFNHSVIINDKIRINPDDASTTYQRENKHLHQIRDDVYVQSSVNVGDKAGFDATPLGITSFTWVSAGTSYYSLTTNAHAIPQGTNVLVKDSASGFQEAYNTTSGAGTTITVERAVDPSSELSVANTTVVVYTPADPRGCLNVAKDFAKFEQNTFNPILRGYVGASSSHPVGINTEVFKIELKRDSSTQDSVATLLHSTREMGSKQRLALTIDDGDSYPDGKSLVLTQTGVKITNLDDFTNAKTLLEVQGALTLTPESNVAEAIRIAPAVDASSQQEFGIGLAVNSSHTHPAAKITFKEFDASDSRGDLLFYTRGVNSDSAPEERLRIASTGVATFTNDSPPATGVGVLFVTDDGSATTLGTAATLRVANNGGNSAYSVFEAQSGSGSIRLANDGQFYVSGASTFSNDIRVDRGSAIDGLLGQAYGGYFGLKQADQSYGSEYMILSNNSNTYISCTSGYGIYIRPSANSSSHETIFAHDNTTFKSNIVLDNHQLRRNQHHKGHMEGSYNNVGANSGKSNPIYTIGSSYNPAESTLSNMYGIGYSHGNNASFISFSGLTGWGLYVAADGDCRMFLDGTTGKIAATGTITGSASDVRLKTNIKVIDNPIEKIKKIRGVTFDWVDNITSEYDFHPDNMHETGVIAQEIQEVIPDAVATAPFNGNYTKKSGTDNNYLTVKNEKIIPLCIEAIKKLTAKVEALESEVNTLKGS